MKLKPIFLLLLLACVSVMATSSSPDPAIFVSSSPCDAVARHYLGIPKDLECEFIKWKLSLHKDPRNQAPTRFELNYTYGMTKPGTEGFMNGGFTKDLNGTWSMEKSKPQSAGSQIVTLTADTGQTKIAFVQLDENVLHLLDLDGHLMIGNAGFSYTLNKQ